MAKYHELIKYKGKHYAEVIRSKLKKKNTTFLSPAKSSFQFGILAHEKGFVEPPHYHRPFKRIIKDLGFKYAFGQHSGVIDETKDLWELPRFPINEKYGEIKRFSTLMKTLPLKFKKISPEDRYLLQSKNPPKVNIEFYENIKNLKQLNCFSNEGNKWRNSKILFKEEKLLEIDIAEKFIGERGRINCSLRERDGFWRWLGIQYVISEK